MDMLGDLIVREYDVAVYDNMDNFSYVVYKDGKYITTFYINEKIKGVDEIEYIMNLYSKGLFFT